MITSNEHVIIYVTCKDQEEAEKIATELLNNNLVACANCFSNTTSIYVWENKLQKHTEAVLILKSKTQYANEIEKMILSLHSYSCPCIICFPITLGSKNFLEWITNSCNIS